MKTLLHIFCILSVAIIAACDLRSGIAKDNMEKYAVTSTPPGSPIPTPTPIAPEDIVEVDVSQEGDWLSVNGYGQKTTTNCTKFNRLKINGNGNQVTIKGVCRQIMINGDKNEIAADGSMEFVFNGSENNVTFSRYPNGKQPLVIENGADNNIEKVLAEATDDRSRRKPS